MQRWVTISPEGLEEDPEGPYVEFDDVKPMLEFAGHTIGRLIRARMLYAHKEGKPLTKILISTKALVVLQAYLGTVPKVKVQNGSVARTPNFVFNFDGCAVVLNRRLKGYSIDFE